MMEAMLKTTYRHAMTTYEYQSPNAGRNSRASAMTGANTR